MMIVNSNILRARTGVPVAAYLHLRAAFVLLILFFVARSERVQAMSTNGVQRIGKVTMTDVTNGGLYSAGVDAANGYAYFGGKHFLTKIDITGNLPVTIGTFTGNAQNGTIIDSAAGYAFCCSGSNVNRISLGVGNAAPTLVDTLSLGTSIAGGVIDTSDPSPANHYVYFLLNTTPSSVVKVSVSSFNPVGNVTFNTGEAGLRRGVIDTQNRYAYFAGPLSSNVNPFVVKMALGTGASAPSRIGVVQLDVTSISIGSAVIDVANGYAYFGAYVGALPAKVYKIALGAGDTSPTLIGSATLSAGTGALNGPNAAERELCSATIDPGNGYAYFGSDHIYPAKIFQINLGIGNSMPTETGMLQLNGGTHALGEPNGGPNDGEQFLPRTTTENIDYGEVFLQSAVIDTTRGDPAAPGSHYAYFGCDSYAGQVIKVLVPPATLTVSPPTLPNVALNQVGYSQAVTVSGNPTPAVFSHSGTVPPGMSFTDSTGILNGTPMSTGTFTFTVTATIASGATGSTTYMVTVGAAMTGTTTVAGAPSPSSSVAGQSVTFPFTVSTNPPGSGIPAGNVIVSDGSISTTVLASAGTAMLTFPDANSRTITIAYQATAAFQASAAAPFSYSVGKATTTLAPGTISPAIAAIGQKVSIPFKLTVTAPGVGSPSGDVTVSDGVTSVTAHVSDGMATIAFPTPGARNITLTYPGDANFSGSTSSKSYTVLANPLIVSGAPNATPNPANSNQPVTFSATASGGVGAITYSWDFGDGSATANGVTVTHTYTSAKSYTAKVTATDTQANTASATTQVTVNVSLPNPILFSSTSPAVPNPAAVHQPIAFSATATGGTGPLAYSWDFGDGSPTASGAAVSHAYASAGTFAATVTVTDTANASASATVTVTVSPSQGGPALVGPGIDTDGDGFSDSLELLAGTDPDSINSTPTGSILSADTIQVLTISKASIKLNFAKKNADSISFSGTVPIPSGFVAGQAKTYYIVGNAIKTLTLGPKASAVIGNDSVKITLKTAKKVVEATPAAKYSVVFNKGSYAGLLIDAGLTNHTIQKAMVIIPFTFIFNNTVYQKMQAMSYTATKGKSGSAK